LKVFNLSRANARGATGRHESDKTSTTAWLYQRPQTTAREKVKLSRKDRLSQSYSIKLPVKPEFSREGQRAVQ
jgi:hypothetical protein